MIMINADSACFEPISMQDLLVPLPTTACPISCGTERPYSTEFALFSILAELRDLIDPKTRKTTPHSVEKRRSVPLRPEFFLFLSK